MGKREIIDEIIEYNCLDCDEFRKSLRESICLCEPVRDLIIWRCYANTEDEIDRCTEIWEELRKKYVRDNFEGAKLGDKLKVIHVGSIGNFVITGNKKDIAVTFVVEEDGEKNWYLESGVRGSDTVLESNYGLPLEKDVIDIMAIKIPDLKKRVALAVARKSRKRTGVSKSKKSLKKVKRFADYWNVKGGY